VPITHRRSIIHGEKLAIQSNPIQSNPIQSLILVLTLVLFADHASALSLRLVPTSPTVSSGDPVAVLLNIAGLGDKAIPSLGAFDVSVTFDPTLLAFVNATFGDPVLSDQLDLMGASSLTSASVGPPNTLNLSEISFDSVNDLNTLQAGSFTLVTLGFTAVMQGVSPLGLNVNALGDAIGDPLTATTETGSITVTPATSAVPEPASGWLAVTGLLLVASGQYSKRCSTAQSD
jgi:hypothetical protein